MTIKIVDDDDEADAIVCSVYRAEEGLRFPDMVLSRCFICDARLQLCPDVPKKIKRICVACAVVELEIEGVEDDRART